MCVVHTLKQRGEVIHIQFLAPLLSFRREGVGDEYVRSLAIDHPIIQPCIDNIFSINLSYAFNQPPLMS